MGEKSDTVVYTAIFDDHDVLLPPKCTGPDFVCFTDDPSTVPEPWEARQFDREDLTPKLKSGLLKTHPHEYVSDYKYSIWMDGNVGLRTNPQDLVEKYLDSVGLAVPAHPFRDCLYDEADYCVKWGLSEPDPTREKMEEYADEGFPARFGLSETRVMLRRHNSQEVVSAMENWWDEYNDGPDRDQLSFEYALWKNDLDYEQLPPEITIDSKYFKFFPHKSDVFPPKLYERALRNVWNRSSIPQYLASAVVLSVLINARNFWAATGKLRRGSPGMVYRMFKHRYL